MFKEVGKTVNFPELEQEVIEFWKTRDIFQKSVEKDAPKGNYVFYEGPPTANGKPGVHHVIYRNHKDLYILGSDLTSIVFGESNYRTLTTFKGEALVGLHYDPILKGRVPEGEDLSGGFRVVGDFASDN